MARRRAMPSDVIDLANVLDDRSCHGPSPFFSGIADRWLMLWMASSICSMRRYNSAISDTTQRRPSCRVACCDLMCCYAALHLQPCILRRSLRLRNCAMVLEKYERRCTIVVVLEFFSTSVTSVSTWWLWLWVVVVLLFHLRFRCCYYYYYFLLVVVTMAMMVVVTMATVAHSLFQGHNSICVGHRSMSSVTNHTSLVTYHII